MGILSAFAGANKYFAPGAEKLGPLTGSKTINDIADYWHLGKSNIFRTGGNPAIAQQTDNANKESEAQANLAAWAAENDVRYGNDGGLYVNPNGSGGASDIGARLTKASWEDYKNRISPYETALMNETTYSNPGIVKGAIGAATDQVNKVYDQAGAIRGRQLASYGVAPTAAQDASFNRESNLNRSLSVVSAAQAIRQKLAERNQNVAIGGIPNAGRQYGLRSTGE